jgi:isatin hydrolase
VKAWEAEHGEIGAGEWVVMRTDWDKRADDEAAFLNADETGRTAPGRPVRLHRIPAGQGHRRLGQPVHRHRCGQAGGMTPPFPAHNLLHKRQLLRAGLAGQPRPAAAEGRDPDRGAAEDRATAPARPIRALALVPKG